MRFTRYPKGEPYQITPKLAAAGRAIQKEKGGKGRSGFPSATLGTNYLFGRLDRKNLEQLAVRTLPR